MKRRTALFGLGLLASGSGAIATSAAVANSVQTASQLSIVVDERLRVRAGQAFNDDGSVKSGYTDQYVPYDSNQSFFDEQDDVLADIDEDEVPVATVSPRNQDVNDDVKIQTAISIDNDTDTFVFNDLLEIENYGGSMQRVGISYDRDDNQYGEDVDLSAAVDDRALTHHDVQAVYQFYVQDPNAGVDLISPDNDNDGNPDDPAGYYGIPPGETVQVNLQMDLTPYTLFNIDPKKNIRSTVEKAPSFSGTTDTVDMLDEITLVRDDS